MMKDRRLLAASAVGVLAVVGLAAAGLIKLPPGILVQGVLAGTVTGLLGVGLVLTYRSTRIINFSYGSMGGAAAAVAVSLHKGKGVPWLVAIPIGVALGALIGVIVERLVIRRFAKSSRLILTVATIGLAQLLGGLQILLPPRLGGDTINPPFPTPLAEFTFSIDPLTFRGDDVLLLAVVPAVLGLLTWFLLKTDAGVAVRGIAENDERARLIGIPVSSLSTLVWAIGGGVAAIAVILTAPTQGLTLDAATGPQILLPALAAAVIANMEDLPKAFGAGIFLGVIDWIVRWNVDKLGVTTVVFLAVILLSLTLKKGAAGRAHMAEALGGGSKIRLPKNVANLPQIRHTRTAVLAVIGVLAVAAPFVAGPSDINMLSSAFIAGVMVVSVVMLTGWGGAVSLGQFAIAGIGGLVTANLLTKTGLDLFVVLVIAAIAGAAIALLLGLPSLRLNSLFLAVTTLAFAVAVDTFVINPRNFPDVMPADVPRPYLWGRFDLTENINLYFFTLGLLVVSCILVSGLRRGRPGRVLLASRDNERGSAAAGIATTRTRLSAFVFAGMLAGVAGASQVVLLGGISLHSFPAGESLIFFSMAVIGGLESMSGALLGVALITFLKYKFPELSLIITGTGLLFVLLLIPRGLTEIVDRVNLHFQVFLAKVRGLQKEVEALKEGFLVAPPTHQPAMAGGGFMGVSASAEASGNGHGDIQGGPPDTRPVLLDCDGVEAAYGQMQVLFGVDFKVRDGELVALLGTNGAGKSTLLKTITGLMETSGGAIKLNGQDVAKLSPEQIARSGVALMPGGRGLFPQLTVAENLRLGAWLVRKDGDAAEQARQWALHTFPVLGQRLDLKAGDLSGGEQQMLSLAMAMSGRPKVLCIDELSLGLAPTVVGTLIEHVKRVHASGTTVVVIEQSVNVALQLAERCVFLEKGQIHFSGQTQELLDRPDLLHSVFIGDASVATKHEAAATTGRRTNLADAGHVRTRTPQVLEVRDVVKRYGGITAVDHVSMTIEPGSVIGIVGHNGAGKTTLFDILSGFNVPDGGRILLGGEDISDKPPHHRAIAGLGRSFQEARLYPSLTVAETVTVALDMNLAVRSAVGHAFRLPVAIDSEADARRQVDKVLDLLGLRSQHDMLVSELSTGTRRIVELACIVALEPSVVLLDEPSGGVSQKEAEALGPLLRQIRDHLDCSMVVIEHDMGLMSNLCDEFIAMELGHVITRGTPAEVLAHPEVVASYLGTDEGLGNRSGSLPGTAPAATPTVDLTDDDAYADDRFAPAGARRPVPPSAPLGRPAGETVPSPPRPPITRR